MRVSEAIHFTDGFVYRWAIHGIPNFPHFPDCPTNTVVKCAFVSTWNKIKALFKKLDFRFDFFLCNHLILIR